MQSACAYVALPAPNTPAGDFKQPSLDKPQGYLGFHMALYYAIFVKANGVEQSSCASS